ncbi:hypothetical protein [Bifidobacterium favimelis]|uniref:Uncharacterized protein n=1 Tax=Bifidobacterium favimelis TaxID=3122979 RepID=A0ABU8ZQ44_9BIFI
MPVVIPDAHPVFVAVLTAEGLSRLHTHTRQQTQRQHNYSHGTDTPALLIAMITPMIETENRKTHHR